MTDTRYRLQLTLLDDDDAPLAGLRTRFTRLNSSSPLPYSLTETGLLFRDEYYLTQTDGSIDVWITDEDGGTVTVLFSDDTVAYQKDVTFSFSAMNVHIESGGSSLPTDLSFSRTGTTVTVVSSTGNDATLPAATTSLAGVLTATDKTKLDGVADGATANSSDATLLDRTNHTGTQTAATISNFSEAVDDRVAALVVAGTNVTVNYNDVANTLTISSLGGGGSTNLSVTRDATSVVVVSDTGTDGTLPVATGSLAGVLSAADKTKLDGVASGATANSADAILLARANHTGTQVLSTISDVSITAANLNALDDGADTTLHFHTADRARANHTGSQVASTISDFSEAVDDRVNSLLVAGTNVSLTYDDPSNTLTINATGGGSSAWGGITGTLSAQTDLQTVLDAKPTVFTPVTLTGATTLNRATHGNRQIIFNGADATLTIASDAGGGWVNDDAVEIHTLAGSSGVPTISTPDGKTITGSATKIIGATRKGVDVWTTGTTDPSAGSGTATLPNLFNGQGFLYAAARGATAPTATGAGGQSAVGTAAAGSGATVAGISMPNRHRITVSTGAVNTNAYCGSASGSEGIVAPNVAADYTARARGAFIPGDGTAACRTFFGLNSATPVATAEPTTFVNCAGFGADSTDTQLFFMSNDGSGSAVKIALNGGSGFPANTALADVYEWYVEIVGGTTRSINYYIKNLVTGVKVTGSTTTSANIPAAGTALRAMQYRNTAATTATVFFEYGSYAGGDWALFGTTS